MNQWLVVSTGVSTGLRGLSLLHTTRKQLLDKVEPVSVISPCTTDNWRQHLRQHCADNPWHELAQHRVDATARLQRTSTVWCVTESATTADVVGNSS